MFSPPNSSPNRVAFSTPMVGTPTRPMVGLSCKAATTKGPDYYKLLSVSSGCNASGEEIKRAYRAMALQYHPDLVCDPLLKEQSTKMFVQLNAAYKTLSDPVLRRQYDDSMMGLNNGYSYERGGFEVDRTVWQRQILELKRRSACQRDRSVSWGGRMRARNYSEC